MNFRPELAQAILEGRKTETRRMLSDNPNSPWWREECAYKPGRDYAICPGRGKEQVGRLEVLFSFKATLGSMTEKNARAEGFESLQEFRETWEALHGSYDPDLEVWVVHFARVTRYTVMSTPGYRDPSDTLDQVREIIEAFPSRRTWWVIDNQADPLSPESRVPEEAIFG